jgi:hypothetical protein
VRDNASLYRAYFQVSADPEGHSQMLWVTDLLPEEVRDPIGQMVEFGSVLIQQTIKRMYRAEQ